MTCEPLFLHIEFFQLELQQPHIDDIACNAGDLYSLANSDSALANQEEIAETRENDVLQCDRDFRSDKPKVTFASELKSEATPNKATTAMANKVKSRWTIPIIRRRFGS